MDGLVTSFGVPEPSIAMFSGLALALGVMRRRRDPRSRTNRRSRPASAPMFHTNHPPIARRLGLAFAENMLRYLSIVGFSIALVACDSEVKHTASYRSPDGKRQITVAQELQGTNDPSPWWTHVSLTTTDDDSPRIPGNMLKLEGRGSIAADWNSSSEVTVFIDDSLFSQISSPSVVLHDTRISYRRASSRTATNSEQAAPSDGEKPPH